MNIWTTLTTLAFNNTISTKQKKEMKKSLESDINDSWAEYNKIPQADKDTMCVELAQSIGCKSSDVIICEKFIYNYSRS